MEEYLTIIWSGTMYVLDSMEFTGVKLKWSTAMSRITANAIMEKKKTSPQEDCDSDLEAETDHSRPSVQLRAKKNRTTAARIESQRVMEQAEKDTVVASFVYDEQKDILQSAIPAGENCQSDDPDGGAEINRSVDEKPAIVKIKRLNPVYQAFDEVEGVDDLYRIAEFCVQPSYLYKNL